ncbi:hypothetical protein QEN19_002750 [Hanseniaspora menglaensis]
MSEIEQQECQSIIKKLFESFTKYQDEKKENDAMLDQLEKMMENVASIYNIDYKTYALEELIESCEDTGDVAEKRAKEYLEFSNQNYNLLRDIQFQLCLRDKLLLLITDFNEVVVYIQKHIQTNMISLLTQNEEQTLLLQRMQDEINGLVKTNEYHNKLDFKQVYIKIMKDLKQVIELLN